MVVDEPFWLSKGAIPKRVWNALLRLGLNEFQAYRAFQIVGGHYNSMRTVTLPDFLTEAQIKKATELYPNREEIREQVIKPNMTEINRKLGQENDPDYLAYAVVYVIMRASEN